MNPLPPLTFHYGWDTLVSLLYSRPHYTGPRRQEV